MVFHWSLSDSKSPQVSRTLLSILAHFTNSVVWMVSTCPVISKSSSPCTNLLVIVPRAPITISKIVIFMFHSFFNSIARSSYLSFFSHSFSFILWSAGTAKSTILQVLFFCWLLLGLAVWPRLGDPFVSQNSRRVCVSFSRTDSGLCKLKNFSHNSHLDYLAHPLVSSLILFLCKFVVFAKDMFEGFVSITIKPTSAVFLRLIYSCFDVVGPYGVVLCC